MKKSISSGLLLGLAGAVVLVVMSPVQAASTTEIIQMKACKNAVLGKPKLRDFPMAAVSVRPGKNKNHVAFTLRWEGSKGHGNCKVSPDGMVKEVNIKEFHRGGGNHHSGGRTEQDGFFVGGDGKWHDPSGDVCNTCTPENGFPASRDHSSQDREIDGFYYDRHMGKWRDSGGEVCNTCTPENGFPDQ